jgi:hypothetical protein
LSDYLVVDFLARYFEDLPAIRSYRRLFDLGYSKLDEVSDNMTA